MTISGDMLASRLKRARKRRWLSLRALGERVGRSHVAIGEVERGDLIPSREMLRRLCEVLGLDVAEAEALAVVEVEARAVARWMAAGEEATW